jgi:hypothetical protein
VEQDGVSHKGKRRSLGLRRVVTPCDCDVEMQTAQEPGGSAP